MASIHAFLRPTPGLNQVHIIVGHSLACVFYRLGTLGIVALYVIYLHTGIGLSFANLTILRALGDHILGHGRLLLVGEISRLTRRFCWQMDSLAVSLQTWYTPRRALATCTMQLLALTTSWLILA